MSETGLEHSQVDVVQSSGDEAEIRFVTSKRSGYVARAHRNPLAIGGFAVPLSPKLVTWTGVFPGVASPKVRVVDIGSGYGGLLLYLATRVAPDCCVLGLEFRTAVWQQAHQKLLELRSTCGAYRRVAFLHTNAQRYLWNYIERASLDALIFAYPDPHFKRKKHRQRIISRTLLPLYAYLLRRGGRIYTSTDVEALYEWMHDRFEESALFVRKCRLIERHGKSRYNPNRVPESKPIEDSDEASIQFFKNDPYAAAVRDWTDEGRRVSRVQGDKFLLVYEKV